MIPVKTLLSQIQTEHVGAMTAATQAVKHALKCGKLLLALKSSVPGEWEKHLELILMPKTTAWRYMKVASDAAKNPAKVKYLLEQGASLVDLYRALDLVKPVVSGAYSADVYQRRKAAEQLEMDFSYEEFTPQLRSLIKASNVEQLSPATLTRLKGELVEAQQRIDAVLAEKGAINLENHEP